MVSASTLEITMPSIMYETKEGKSKLQSLHENIFYVSRSHSTRFQTIAKHAFLGHYLIQMAYVRTNPSSVFFSLSFFVRSSVAWWQVSISSVHKKCNYVIHQLK